MEIPIPRISDRDQKERREGEFTIVDQIKPEFPHIFVWYNPPGTCKGRDRITQECEGVLGKNRLKCKSLGKYLGNRVR